MRAGEGQKANLQEKHLHQHQNKERNQNVQTETQGRARQDQGAFRSKDSLANARGQRDAAHQAGVRVQEAHAVPSRERGAENHNNRQRFDREGV